MNKAIKYKAQRIFANRTHKFPDKKVEIIQDPEVRGRRFIIAPYDHTVEKIESLVSKEVLAALDRLDRKGRGIWGVNGEALVIDKDLLDATRAEYES